MQAVHNKETAISWHVSVIVIKSSGEEQDCIDIEVDCGGRMSIKEKGKSLRQLKCRSSFANTFIDGAKIELHTILYLESSTAHFQQEKLKRNHHQLLVWV